MSSYRVTSASQRRYVGAAELQSQITAPWTPNPWPRPGYTRFVCVSDTHAQSGACAMDVPAGDVLVHAGDFTVTGTLDECRRFGAFLARLPHRRKLVVPGNHDVTFDDDWYGTGPDEGRWRRFHRGYRQDPVACRAAVADACPRVELLLDSATTVDGLKVWGAPWQPSFSDWAFQADRGPALRAKWDAIPGDTDVLITHGPPAGVGDVVVTDEGRREHVGCYDLLDAVVSRVRPAAHVFGHIHDGHGAYCATVDGGALVPTLFINAATCDETYTAVHAPIVFDLPRSPTTPRSPATPEEA